jgi:SAM-dependent methyltransferase
MSVEPYHRFVFDTDRRRVVGSFEEMYRAEDAEGFDSWHQDDLSRPRHRIALALLSGTYDSLLDVGCGKGAMTGLLASFAARTVGVDVSPAAIEKARARFPGIDFRVAGRSFERELAGEHFSLVTCMEVLSYIEDWRGELQILASLGERLFLSLYLPPDPIGYVKSLDELRAGFSAVAEIETEVLIDGSQLLLLGTSR